MADPAGEDWPRRSSLFRIVVLVFVLNLTSAALFIARVNRPVYDDGFNIYDVHNYAARGLSYATLNSQRNPPGPTSFVWMAAAVRLIGGNELRDARIGALFSWLLLGTAVLLGASLGRAANLWCCGLLVLLVFPHAVEASATVLTEGPALLFAVIGALAWTEFVARPDSDAASLPLGVFGCLFMGLAVTCRQYYLALLPAAGLTAAVQWQTKTWRLGERRRFTVRALVALVFSLVPVALLILAWGGIASPGMETGKSYNMMYKASAGLNLTRPIDAALRLGVYLVPFTFPLMARVKRSHRWRMLGIAALSGLAAGYWTDSLLQAGPLNTVVGFVGRTPLAREIVFGAVAAATIYNAMAVGAGLWEKRSFLLSSPPAAFSLLAILFFIGEQVGVGGNIPFYDRYVLQAAPFIGALAFTLLPSLDKARLLALTVLCFLSHLMLWRYVFGS